MVCSIVVSFLPVLRMTSLHDSTPFTDTLIIHSLTVFQANTIIPPPYSCMGSLEEVSPATSHNSTTINLHQLPRSASSSTCNGDRDHLRVQNSPSVHSHLSSVVVPFQPSQNPSRSVDHQPPVLIRSNPIFGDFDATTNFPPSRITLEKVTAPDGVQIERSRCVKSQTNNCDASPLNTLHKVNRKAAFVAKDVTSVDSESQEEEHNFSDLLNLSVCAPSCTNPIPVSGIPHLQELQQSFSVANSMTSSDISSLANLGTPDSPPRATSPTVEMKELLDKIQQLPQQKSPVMPETSTKSKGYFHRSKAKTLYMPLAKETNKTPHGRNGGIFTRGSRSWLSRSAPTTPCDVFSAGFPGKKGSNSHKNSKTKISDGSPLLNENEESEDDVHHRDECL